MGLKRDNSDVHSAIADVTRTGSEVVNNVSGYRMPGAGFIERMASFENNLVQRGKDSINDFAEKGSETIKHTKEAFQDFGKSVEEKFTTGAEDLAKTTQDTIEEITLDVEEEVTKVSEDVKDNLKAAKNKVEDVLVGEHDGEDSKKETNEEEDVGANIDEILALTVDEKS